MKIEAREKKLQLPRGKYLQIASKEQNDEEEKNNQPTINHSRREGRETECTPGHGERDGKGNGKDGMHTDDIITH